MKRKTRKENFVGNGPFILKDWKPQQVLIAARNPRFWDHARVRLDEIHFFAVENQDSEERMFRTGQLDLTNELPVAKIDVYRKEFPESLRIDPSNEWARENLVRALREKKRKDSEQERNKKKDRSQDTDKQPPPMDRRDMQRLLDALREQEKRIRQKAGMSGAGVPASREKDW